VVVKFGARSLAELALPTESIAALFSATRLGADHRIGMSTDDLNMLDHDGAELDQQTSVGDLFGDDGKQIIGIAVAERCVAVHVDVGDSPSVRVDLKFTRKNFEKALPADLVAALSTRIDGKIVTQLATSDGVEIDLTSTDPLRELAPDERHFKANTRVDP
jgi:hypothetical protein